MFASRRFFTQVVPLFAAIASAQTANAQAWVTLPNGQYGYITNYTTTGFFQCVQGGFFLIGTCQASGNAMTLGSGTATMTLTFTGLSQLITATSRSQSVNLGTVTKTFGGTGPFLFPTSRNINASLFFFSIVLNSSFPRPVSGTFTAGYLPTSRTSIPRNCCQNHRQYIAFGTTTPPPGIPHYPYVIYHSLRGNTMTVHPNPLNISATVAIIPEPATIWLTATGLAGLAAIVRRRRRR